jgi:3-oxoadipate enol-lactonase
LPGASLVGLPLGARTLIDFALTYPDMVDRLVLVSPDISGMTFRDLFVLEQYTRITEAAAAGDCDQAVLGAIDRVDELRADDSDGDSV